MKPVYIADYNSSEGSGAGFVHQFIAKQRNRSISDQGSLSNNVQQPDRQSLYFSMQSSEDISSELRGSSDESNRSCDQDKFSGKLSREDTPAP